jgi:hypothetical protein
MFCQPFDCVSDVQNLIGRIKLVKSFRMMLGPTQSRVTIKIPVKVALRFELELQHERSVLHVNREREKFSLP